uniref:Uncharacterized protein MANES_13G022300 n=1 Tax=Rhizophora mucronata TaxID=61149 RepID=A0A2P2ISG0_RHIMU
MKRVTSLPLPNYQPRPPLMVDRNQKP